jgi:hypothetical protein
MAEPRAAVAPWREHSYHHTMINDSTCQDNAEAEGVADQMDTLPE